MAFLKWIRQGWSVLGIALLFFLALEFFSHSLILFKEKGLKDIDPRVAADGYKEASWVWDYYQEFNASNRTEWHPYVYWRRKPFQGKFIKVNEEGIRKTWNPPQGNEKPFRIFMFGGSTLWGSGVRDDFTMASQLSQILFHEGRNVEITNFGESGYVSTQEFMTLWIELRKGNVPDLVIFLDGVNDVYSAFQNHKAGIPQNEFNRTAEFNLTNETRRVDLVKSAFLKLPPGTARLLRSVYRRMTGREGVGMLTGRKLSPEQESRLAEEVIKSYAWNINAVERLAEAHGFQTLFYWQPVVFTKQNLTAYEQEAADDQGPVRNFYLQIYKKIEESSELSRSGNFHNLSAIFGTQQEPVFIDFVHLTEAASGQAARRILEDVLQKL